MSRQYERKYRTAPLVTVDQPDWASLVKCLIAAGYPKSQIAKAANCARETIYTILRGTPPEWRVGQALLKLNRMTSE